jgi:hypothetical protein
VKARSNCINHLKNVIEEIPEKECEELKELTDETLDCSNGLRMLEDTQSGMFFAGAVPSQSSHLSIPSVLRSFSGISSIIFFK